MWSGNTSNPIVHGAAALTAAALVILGLHEGKELFIPLATAGILSFILFPLVRRLVHLGIPQGLAVAFVMTTLIGVLFGSITLAGRQVAQLLEEVPRHETNLREKARNAHVFLGGAGIWQRAFETLHNVEQEIHDPEAESKPLKIEVTPDRSLSVILEYTRSTLPSIATAGLSLVMTIFILLQYSALGDRIVRLMGVAEIGRSTQALNEAGEDVAHFLLLQTCLNISFGIFISITLWLIGVPSAGLWGAVAALMRFVPYLGSVLSAIFPTALAAMVDSGWWMLVETVVLFIGGDIIVGQFIEPILFGSRTRLSSIAVVLGTAFWTLLWGPVGLILAVPLTLTMVVIGQHIPHLEVLRILLGNEPVLEPGQRLYRQLLVGDTTEAVKDAAHRLEESGYVKYLDEAVVACLQMASDDRHRGVLGKEQLDNLRSTLPEYIAQVKELLDFEYEQERPRIEKASPGRAATAIVIGGRGVLDHAAAELVAGAICFELGISVQCPALGGLTGITAARQTTSDPPADIIALISVGEVTATQVDLLVGRVTRVFKGSPIAIGYWGSNAPKLPQKERPGSLVLTADTVNGLVETIRRIIREQSASSHVPVPRELA